MMMNTMELYHSLYHPVAAVATATTTTSTAVNTTNDGGIHSTSNLLLYSAPPPQVESNSSNRSSPNHLNLLHSLHPNTTTTTTTTQMQHLLSTAVNANNSYPLTSLMLEKQLHPHSTLYTSPSAFQSNIHHNHPYLHHHQLSHNLLQNQQQLLVLNQQNYQQQALYDSNMVNSNSNNTDFLGLDMDEALFSHIQQLQELTSQPQQCSLLNHLPQQHAPIQLPSQHQQQPTINTLSYKVIAQQQASLLQQQQLQQQVKSNAITQSPTTMTSSSLNSTTPLQNTANNNIPSQNTVVNDPSSTNIVENNNAASSNHQDSWQTEWLDSKREHEWELGEFPQFKACKKRKEFFTSQFETIWYKIPYKYHMLMKMNSFGNDYVSTATLTSQNAKQPSRKALNELNKNKVKCRVEICFEDGSPVLPGDGQPCCMSNTEHSFDGMNLKLGPFQFNICSYKYGYKKFRLLVILSVREGNTNSNTYKDVVVLKSPPFVIKSKKPIARPGSKKQQQQQQASTSSSSSSPNSSHEEDHDSPRTTVASAATPLSPPEESSSPNETSPKPSMTLTFKKGSKRTRDQESVGLENTSASTPSFYAAGAQSPFSSSNMFASNLFDTCESLKLQGNSEQHTLMEQQLLTLLLGSMNPTVLDLPFTTTETHNNATTSTVHNIPIEVQQQQIMNDFVDQSPTWNTYERELKKMCTENKQAPYQQEQQQTDVNPLFGLK